MLRQTLVFVAVLVVLNAIFYILNIPIQINIIGSVVLSILVGAIMYFINRRRTRYR